MLDHVVKILDAVRSIKIIICKGKRKNKGNS